MGYSDNLNVGNMYNPNYQAVDMGQVEMMVNMEQNQIVEEDPNEEIEDEIINSKDQLKYLEKVEQEKINVEN